MHYQDGTQKLIEGQPHYWNSTKNGWVNPNNGFVLTEAQLQEMQYHMYSEDAYNNPEEVIYSFPFTNAGGSSGGSVTIPDEPRRGTKDYNRIRVEVVSNGASGGEVLVGTPQDLVPTAAAGGGGAGCYGTLVYKFNRAVDISGYNNLELKYKFPTEMHWTHGTTLELETPNGDIVGRFFPGSVGNTMPADIAATGGTGAWSANPAATYFVDVSVTQGGTGGVTGNVGGFTAGGEGGTPNRMHERNTEERSRSFTALSGNGGATGNPRGVGTPREALAQSFDENDFTWGAGGGGGCTANMNLTAFETSGVTRGQAGSPGGVKVTWYHVDRVSP